MSKFPYKLDYDDLKSNHIIKYAQIIRKAQNALETNVIPLFDEILKEYNQYSELLKKKEE